MTERNRRMILAERPTGLVDDETVKLQDGPVPVVGPGEALVKVRYLSIDATIRTWMDGVRGYLPSIAVGEVVRSAAIGEVITSESRRYPVGSLVFGLLGWQDYTIVDETARAAWPVAAGVDPPTALNVYGVTGMTAYFGLLDVGGMLEGDVVVVSAAAGGTGSTAGQIARLKGAGKVVGITGGPEKCKWIIDELGFDAAVDYRDKGVAGRLKELCPSGIDLYFDSVGGDILNACLARLAMRGRVVLAGAISTYNHRTRTIGPSNYRNLIGRRGRMEGFIVVDYASRFPEARAALAPWLADGRLKHFEHIVEGLEHAPEALNLLFSGSNIGKVVVKL